MLPKYIFFPIIIIVIFCFCGCSDTTSISGIQPTPTSTQPPRTSGSIQGVVSDEFAVMPNAFIKFHHFQSSSNDSNVFTTIANERGEYLINDIPPGQGLVEAWLTKEGHDNMTENPIANYKAEIILGKTITQDIKYGHFDAYGKSIK